MRPITDSFVLLWSGLLLAVVLPACSSYTPQRIERDTDLWYPYHFMIDDAEYRVRIPSGALILTKPTAYIKTSNLDDYFIAAAFGFDFGRGSYDDIAQFRTSVGISRIDSGITCNKEDYRFGECMLKDSRTYTKDHVNRYRQLGALLWFHESDIQHPWDAYSILLGETHYLTISARYWDDLAARPGMLADRRKLLEEIVGTFERLD